MKRNFELDEIHEVAKELLEKAPNKVLCLYGDMGVGKTTLVKALVKELGAVDVASSPTFGLVNEYHDDKDTPIAYHFDFYRLNDEMEALDMGLEDYLSSDAWLFIEWPDKIPSLLPEDAVGVFLHFVEESTRSIELNIS
ncbi:MAG: tRNA (adenosine(37)-N6)-threonylcarbamoyltransferase complex ATPase subunit type 1 TsaE [Muricauda sp.]|nr:tRNA (adenosine(37)-N6)-threonylcarbamoyltransferase complex ATPase subunit type 1 TsaE [Allomuricauda sp.]MBA4743904.1 tRNA (adenosine(37)-N6)-threonylcarbamoyltransferase complex ATPase subunit type 1 TsaE [Allomuricauda sp.]